MSLKLTLGMIFVRKRVEIRVRCNVITSRHPNRTPFGTRKIPRMTSRVNVNTCKRQILLDEHFFIHSNAFS